MVELHYTPRRSGYELHLAVEDLTATVRRENSQCELENEGNIWLLANVALMTSVASYGDNELAQRRLRAPEKREAHAKAAIRCAREATAIAAMIANLGDRRMHAWCSGCFEQADHIEVRGSTKPRTRYLCENCGTPTVRCSVPRCQHHAVYKPTTRVNLGFCAPHSHAIPSFEKLTDRLGTLGDSTDWLHFESRNADRITKVTGGTIGAVAVVGPTIFFAAPALGAALGGSALGGGLTGAAATSHGLAMFGFGSLASGGLGMAGGTFVLTATGSALGGILGATTTSAYVGSDKSFKIEKVRTGTGPIVLVASGFLTDGKEGWGGWRKIVEERYPDATVYRVHWGAKELKSIGILAGQRLGKAGAKILVQNAAKKGAKAFDLGPVGAVLLAHDVVVNPWSLAKSRAAMTGAVIADLISRTDEGPYVLIGHSLGARAILTAAQALGTQTGAEPRIEAMHLLGAAVSTKGDWRSLSLAVSGTIWNYRSINDDVLGKVYAVAEVGRKAVGRNGFNSKWPNIKDVDVSRVVGSHGAYRDNVKLK